MKRGKGPRAVSGGPGVKRGGSAAVVGVPAPAFGIPLQRGCELSDPGVRRGIPVRPGTSDPPQALHASLPPAAAAPRGAPHRPDRLPVPVGDPGQLPVPHAPFRRGPPVGRRVVARPPAAGGAPDSRPPPAAPLQHPDRPELHRRGQWDGGESGPPDMTPLPGGVPLSPARCWEPGTRRPDRVPFPSWGPQGVRGGAGGRGAVAGKGLEGAAGEIHSVLWGRPAAPPPQPGAERDPGQHLRAAQPAP